MLDFDFDFSKVLTWLQFVGNEKLINLSQKQLVRLNKNKKYIFKKYKLKVNISYKYTRLFML